MKMLRRLSLSLLLAGLAACSTEQAYNSVKGWQRNECNKRVDNREREQCLKDADRSYDDYRKERAQ